MKKVHSFEKNRIKNKIKSMKFAKKCRKFIIEKKEEIYILIFIILCI